MFSYNEYLQNKTQIQRNISFIPGPEGPPGGQGPQGPTGPEGPVTYSIVPKIYAGNFYTNNLSSLSIPTNQSVFFSTGGVVQGTEEIKQVTETSFKINLVGIYHVLYQLSITGYARVVLTLNGTPLQFTYNSYDAGEGISQISFSTLINVTSENSMLTLQNVSGIDLNLQSISDGDTICNITIVKLQA